MTIQQITQSTAPTVKLLKTARWRIIKQNLRESFGSPFYYERSFNYATRGETAYPVGTTNYVDRISYYNVVNNVATFEKAENIEYNADGHIVTYGDNT